MNTPAHKTGRTARKWHFTGFVEDELGFPCVTDGDDLVICSVVDDGISEDEQRAHAHLIAAAPDLVKALEDLVNAKALQGVRQQVAGWNGEGRDTGPFERHPPRLGATLPKTDCGAIYELDDAMQAARAALSASRSTGDQS